MHFGPSKSSLHNPQHTLLWVKFLIFKKARETKSWDDTNHFLVETWCDNWSCPAVQSICGLSRGMPAGSSKSGTAMTLHPPFQYCSHVHSAQHCSWFPPGSIQDLEPRDMSLCSFFHITRAQKVKWLFGWALQNDVTAQGTLHTWHSTRSFGVWRCQLQ